MVPDLNHVNVAPAAADHGRRNDRRADGACVHRLDNRYDSHEGPPHGRNLDHADAVYHALSPGGPACSDQGSALLFRRHAHRRGRLQRVEGALDQDNRRGLRAEPRGGHIPAHERAFGE